MSQTRLLGILLALGTLFVLFFNLVPPTGLIAGVLIGLGWIALVVSVFKQRAERLKREEARFAAHMEVWMAAMAKQAEEKKKREAAALATDFATAPPAEGEAPRRG